MSRILAGVRPMDYVLTAVMVVLAVLIALENIQATVGAGLAHPLDSQSVWMLPVFVATAMPILWRRRNILAGIAASTLILVASLPIFGWVTRCGFALPLAIAMAYAVARFAGPARDQVLGLVGVVLLQVVTLVMDASTGGLGALAISLPLSAVAYGAGLVVQRRAVDRRPPTTLTTEHVAV